ncbi:DUF6048 family protein [Gammaproteobacteria bacterium]|nr:DUF6048 family protein [Gammaproteobacteria bacterium]
MMIKKISGFVFLVCFFTMTIGAVELPDKYKSFQGEAYQGWSLMVDGFSPLMASSLDKDIYYYQLTGNVNLFNKIFPTLEIGYASVDKKLPSKAEYSANSPYLRLGVDYNLLTTIDKDGKPKNSKSFCYLGGRYASTYNNYSMKNVSSNDNYWQEQQFKSILDQQAYVGWFEFLFGVHIDIYKGLSLGWCARVKTFLHSSAENNTAMWYVPGYGFSDSASFEFNYTIGYTFGK